MKSIPLTKLKHTCWPDIRDWLQDGAVLITRNNKPLAEMWPPGEVERLLDELRQLIENDNDAPDA